MGGTQTPEGLLSIVCESFGCLPHEALDEDPQLVVAILEYRLARQAKDQFNENAGKLVGATAELWAEINFELQDRMG